MKIYTKTGDKGETSLFSGERILKSHDRIIAYGNLDELNSFIGLINSVLDKENQELKNELKDIQVKIIKVSSWLATNPESKVFQKLEEIPDTYISNLELSIDKMEEKLPKLKSFILPGGHISSSYAHLSRTITRRAERKILYLFEKENIEKTQSYANIIRFLNRLSDYFFVLARYLNYINNIEDELF